MGPLRTAAPLVQLAIVALALSCSVTPEAATPDPGPGPDASRITGTIADAAGTGTPGVTVTLAGASLATATTDQGGRYAFLGLPDGPFQVTPARTGYTFSPSSRTVTVQGSEAAAQDFTATRTGGAGGGGPLLSWLRPVHVSGGVASRCNDGKYGQDFYGVGTGVDNRWSSGSPAWCAIHLGTTTATTVLVGLSDETGADGIEGTPGFADYALQASADSTDGADGTWSPPIAVTGNRFAYREHLVGFAGMQWIRISIAAPATASLDDLEVWDVSDAAADALAWVGDSITARCSARSGGFGADPSFQAAVLAAAPPHYPLQIGAGAVGVTARDVVSGSPSRLDTYLSLFPHVRFWGIALGTNDAANDVPSATFQASLQALVDRVRAGGHVPIIARIPYTSDPAYGAQVARLNGVVDAVTALNGLTPGPDLYTLFQQHQAAYYDSDPVHPNKDGCTAWQRAWAQVLVPLL